MNIRLIFAFPCLAFGLFFACDEDEPGCSEYEETYSAAIFVRDPADWVNGDGTLVSDDCRDYCPEADSLLGCGGASVEPYPADSRPPDEVIGGAPGVGSMGGAGQIWVIKTQCTHDTYGACAEAEED
ncbi:MAG: hypothetical protein MK135_10620 [Polyangiaceae bacterium]|nr:hypothetical protein [Polyangiaceae bacterium]